MGELKPCPFCPSGGDPQTDTADIAIFVVCMECGCSSRRYYYAGESAKDAAIACWNRRTHPQPVTPAGGEVVGWQERYLHGLAEERWQNCVNETPQYRERLKFDFAFRPLYTHPPVADAALAVDEAMLDRATAAFLKDNLVQLVVDRVRMKAAIDAALNQRGGGDHG